MSTPDPLLTDDVLTREAERTFYDYSFAWEGEEEQVIDHGDVLIRDLPVPWGGIDAVVERMAFDPAHVEERLDTVFAEVRAHERRIWWILGESTQPADLRERLEARGLQVTINWDCLALTDMAAEFPRNPDVVVEPLAEANVADYAALCNEEDPGHNVYEGRLAAAYRYLQLPQQDAHIYLARVDGQPAACVVLRIEPTGVAYLRNAFTLERFRGRGVYLALVGRRVAVARAAGCHAAVVQAQIQSSSPILRKRGFRRVAGMQAMEYRKEQAGAT